MIIQIELIVIAIIAFIFLAWSIWFRWSRRRARKKYNPDNVKYKTREGGAERGASEVGGGEPSLAEATDSVPRPSEPAERVILPPTDTNVSGTNVRSFGNAIRRTRRRK